MLLLPFTNGRNWSIEKIGNLPKLASCLSGEAGVILNIEYNIRLCFSNYVPENTGLMKCPTHKKILNLSNKFRKPSIVYWLPSWENYHTLLYSKSSGNTHSIKTCFNFLTQCFPNAYSQKLCIHLALIDNLTHRNLQKTLGKYCLRTLFLSLFFCWGGTL